MSESENEKKKNIEVVSGDGSNLEISPVLEHLKVARPKMKEFSDKEVVIPKSKNAKKNSKKDVSNK